MNLSRGKKLLTFGMAYLNGMLHGGHLMLFANLDIGCKLLNCLGYDARFENAYHATGQPIATTLSAINSGVKTHEYLKIVKKPIDFTEWVEKHIEYNNHILQKLCIDFDRGRTFTTTEYDEIYSNFVNWQFKVLFERGLLECKDHELIWCNSCNVPLGDHDRKVGEGIFLVETDFEFIKSSTGEYKLNIKNNSKTEQAQFRIADLIFSAPLSWIKTHELILSNALIIDKITKVSEDVLSIRLNSFSSEVVCRCGSNAVIGIERNQYFIRYSDEQWRAQTRFKIESSELMHSSTKLELLRRLNELRAWPFSRKTGYGTVWLNPFVQQESSQRLMIEPLSDSCLFQPLHMIYSEIRLIWDKIGNKFNLWDYIFGLAELDSENNPSTEIESILEIFKKWKSTDYHVIGKDLVQNHVLFSIFFHTLFLPTEALPLFKVRGHLMWNGAKMSKSTGNVLTFQDLSKYSTDSVRFVLGTLGDSTSDSNLKSTELATTEKLVKVLISNLKQLRQSDSEKTMLPVQISKLYESLVKVKFIQAFHNIIRLNLKQVSVLVLFELNKIFKKCSETQLKKYRILQFYLISAYCPNSIVLTNDEVEIAEAVIDELILESGNEFNSPDIILSLLKTAQSSKKVLDFINSSILKLKKPTSKNLKIMITKEAVELFKLLLDPEVISFIEQLVKLPVTVELTEQKWVNTKNFPKIIYT